MGSNIPKYKPEYCQLFIDMMKEGRFVVEFCSKVGVCKKTVQNWQKAYPEFGEAYAIGRACAEAWWAEKMRSNLHYDIKRPFNTAGWAKVMGSCFRWSDKVEEKVEQKTEIKLSYNLDERPERPDKLDSES